MKLGYTIVYVNNVPETLAFYEKAFGLKKKFLHESNQYGELDTGLTVLAFSQDDFAYSLTGLKHHINRGDNDASGFELVLVTDDVTKALETAKAAGANIVAEPKETPWGQTIAYVRDLNGVIIEIATPVA